MGPSFGAGGGKTNVTGGAFQHALGERGGRLIGQSGKLRRETFAQALEALKTGGVGAQIPMIQRGVEGAKSATSQILQQLGQSPLASTPFGQRVRSQAAMLGALQQANLPVTMAQGAVQQGLGLVGPTLQAGTGLLGQAAGIQGIRSEAQAMLRQQQMQGVQDLIQNILGFFGGASQSPSGGDASGGGGAPK